MRLCVTLCCVLYMSTLTCAAYQKELLAALDDLKYCTGTFHTVDDGGDNNHDGDSRADQLMKLVGLPRGRIQKTLMHLKKTTCLTNHLTCTSTDSYSSFDGRCNNFQNPMWGVAGVAALRDLPAEYADGVQALRKSVTGAPLPNPRDVSNVVFSADEHVQSNRYSLWLMAFGQQLAHDIVLTTLVTDKEGGAIDCCNEETFSLCPHQCIPIDVSGDDYFSTVNQQCLNFVRSTIVPCDLCDETQSCERNQANAISAYIDGTAIYGTDATDAESLRDGCFLKEGTYKASSSPHSYLPGDFKVADACLDGTVERPCYDAGDPRVNEVPNLQTILTIFMREHNRIAGKLKALGNGWDDSEVYHEARKIVVAMLQKISLHDFASMILGGTTAAFYGLTLESGYQHIYNDKINAGVSNQMGAAALRFGHTLIPNKEGMYDTSGTLVREFDVHENFFKVKETYDEPGHDALSRYLQKTGSGEPDRVLTDSVRNKLFPDDQTHHSSDLAAFNILRGRDHGLASYNRWKEWCGQQPFPADHSTENAQLLMDVYANKADIDLYPGAMTETLLPGAVVGPLFACMIGRQLKRTKTGDRFYFQNPQGLDSTTLGRFTEDQVLEIEKQTLSRIICSNTNTDTIQPNVFLLPSVDYTNMPVDCDSLEDIDFKLWRN